MQPRRSQVGLQQVYNRPRTGGRGCIHGVQECSHDDTVGPSIVRQTYPQNGPAACGCPIVEIVNGSGKEWEGRNAMRPMINKYNTVQFLVILQ